MRNLIYKTFLVILLFTVGSQTVFGETDKLAKLKNIYTQQVIKLKTARNQKLDALDPEYLLDLKALEKQYQNSGELEPLLVVRKEYDRFKNDRDISDVEPVSSPAGLEQLQNKLIENEKNIKLLYANTIIKLGENYKKSLNKLKKELTKEGKINDALKAMEEIETIDTLPEIVAANAQIDAGGTLEVERDIPQPALVTQTQEKPEPKPVASTKPQKKLTKDVIEQYFHTRISEWNSITKEITCIYDFNNEDQIKAWKGGKFDKLRNRLICDNKMVWLIPTFASIKKIECDAFYYSGTSPIRIRLNKSLYADLTPTRDGYAILHQGNPSFPLKKSFGGALKYETYHNIITINGWNAQWSVGSRNLPDAKIIKPISVPVRIGVGSDKSKTMYTDIRITGKLSSETIKAILQQ